MHFVAMHACHGLGCNQGVENGFFHRLNGGEKKSVQLMIGKHRNRMNPLVVRIRYPGR